MNKNTFTKKKKTQLSIYFMQATTIFTVFTGSPITPAVSIDELSQKALEAQKLDREIEILEKKAKLDEIKKRFVEKDLDHSVKKKELMEKLSKKADTHTTKNEISGNVNSSVVSPTSNLLQSATTITPANSGGFILDNVGDDIVLTAIYGQSSNPIAEVAFRGSVFSLKRGDTVNGWRANQISRDRVVLSRVIQVGKKKSRSESKTIYLSSPDASFNH